MKQKPPHVPMLDIDLTALEALLVADVTYCKICGAKFPMFPPDKLNEHIFESHESAIPPEILAEWRKFTAEPDLAEREEMRHAQWFGYTISILSERYDVRRRAIEAGILKLEGLPAAWRN
jgi:hypothetical protein